MHELLSILLHPKRALARIRELTHNLEQERDTRAAEIRIADARRRELETDLDYTRKEVGRLSARCKELDTRLQTALHDIERGKREYDELQAQIPDAEAMEGMMRQIEESVKQMEALKRDYQRRIETLRMQLSDARRRLREAALGEGLDPRPIDMTAADSRPRRKDPDTWFRSLPENL